MQSNILRFQNKFRETVCLNNLNFSKNSVEQYSLCFSDTSMGFMLDLTTGYFYYIWFYWAFRVASMFYYRSGMGGLAAVLWVVTNSFTIGINACGDSYTYCFVCALLSCSHKDVCRHPST